MALLLPTHFFYSFLYYTDVGGVTCVLACYLVRPSLWQHKPAGLSMDGSRLMVLILSLILKWPLSFASHACETELSKQRLRGACKGRMRGGTGGGGGGCMC